jgi:osmotically-inducible protein OsmY
VPWQFHKTVAAKAIEPLYGVKGVSRSVIVRPPVAAADVREKIEQAFRRSADIEARRITVEARDGLVVLKGTVYSLSERDAAEHAVWAAPGVVALDDQLVVAP